MPIDFFLSEYAEKRLNQKGEIKNYHWRRELWFKILFPEFWLLVMESSFYCTKPTAHCTWITRCWRCHNFYHSRSLKNNAEESSHKHFHAPSAILCARNKPVICLNQYSLWGFFLTVFIQQRKRNSRHAKKWRKASKNEYKSIKKRPKRELGHHSNLIGIQAGSWKGLAEWPPRTKRHAI